MMLSPYSFNFKYCYLALVLVVLSGCASINLEQTLDRVNKETGDFSGSTITLAHTEDEQTRRLRITEGLLANTLGQHQAVQLAVVNDPALQALLAQGWAASAEAAQIGRLPNPIFSFERMVNGDEREFGRALSFGLFNLLTLPLRQSEAKRRLEKTQLDLSGEVINRVTQVRQAWVRAVAAGQTLQYAQKIFESAQASAELARRMQSAGNFNRLSRAREQSFYADAAVRLATARHQAQATREALVRLLGLDDTQAEQLKLPERLPDLPQQPKEPSSLNTQATEERLDIRLARAALDAAAKAQGLNIVTTLTDIELTLRRNTQFDHAAGTRSDPRGYEVGVRLPIFDWGNMQRDAMNARTLAAAHQLEATVRSAASHLRESYSAYRTMHDIARHYRDEIIPLRQVISEENQRRYNAMIMGVFELLADTRDQIHTVMAAIEAEQQFWLADAALQAALIGRPTDTTLSFTPSAPAPKAAGH